MAGELIGANLCVDDE